MKTCLYWLGIAGLAAGLAAGPAAGANTPASDRLRALRSTLEALGDRAIPEARWQALTAELEELASSAESGGSLALAAEARVLQAQAWGHMRHDPARAAALLREFRRRMQGRTVPAMNAVYLAEADLLARAGNPDAIRRLILEFKSSPYFDAAPARYTVEDGHQLDVQVQRPYQRGSDSLTVTAMQRYLEQAAAAVRGTPFPEFTLTDDRGRTVRRTDFQGKVLLVDVWSDGSAAWQRSLPALLQAYRESHAAGFEILGICQNLDGPGLAALRAGAPGIAWRLVPAAEGRALTRSLGIFGETTNYLVDRHGVIRGRNLRGADLVTAVRGLLEETD